MEKSKILFVNQEMVPYTKENSLSWVARKLPQAIQENGKEIRTFMPRFGIISERRNQLHEVKRLSGMNLVIDDIDYPLITKVGSLPEARMQTYFIDNDDFFSKRTLTDKSGKLYEDTDIKMIFFARGVVETTLKLNWFPNLIHCNGWFASLLPLYVRRFYKNNPIYKDVKVVISLFDETFKGKIGKKIQNKLLFDKIPAKDIARYEDTAYISVMKAAIDLSDGVIITEEGVKPELIAHAKKARKPILPFKGEDALAENCNAFYDKILLK